MLSWWATSAGPSFPQVLYPPATCYTSSSRHYNGHGAPSHYGAACPCLIPRTALCCRQRQGSATQVHSIPAILQSSITCLQSGRTKSQTPQLTECSIPIQLTLDEVMPQVHSVSMFCPSCLGLSGRLSVGSPMSTPSHSGKIGPLPAPLMSSRYPSFIALI